MIHSFSKPLGKVILIAALAIGTGAAGLYAETCTLTDKRGRSLKAEVISVDGNNVTIKRDDGQTFSVALGSLDADSQKFLKDWAAKQAAGIPAGGVELQISRGKFDTKKKDDGSGMVISEEQWGYSATLFNRTNKPLKEIRVDYVLFMKPDREPGKDKSGAPLKQQAGSNQIDAVSAHDSINFRTSSITIYKEQLKPGWVWAKTGSNKAIRDTLYGAWLRVYIGDQLVNEVCSPPSLAKTETWPGK